MVIDALDRPHPLSTLGTRWEVVTDRVMGGLSTAALRRETVAGRSALRLTGTVSLENNGGFVQMALDLAPDGSAVDLSGCSGLVLDVRGNDQPYGVHLRTLDVARPWQSYRAEFLAASHWQTLSLPFADFVPHRIVAPLDLSRVRRIGLVAIGRPFSADLALARIVARRAVDLPP